MITRADIAEQIANDADIATWLDTQDISEIDKHKILADLDSYEVADE